MTDPFALFDTWFAEAQASEPNDPNAMALATAERRRSALAAHGAAQGAWAGRFRVLHQRGSRKADDLAQNAQAALLFHWKSLRRQVRIEGPVSLARPTPSRTPISPRAVATRSSAPGHRISRVRSTPARNLRGALRGGEGAVRRAARCRARRFWGGYRVAPERIEFWQDRAHRLHERRLFTPTAATAGDEGLLYP